MTGVRYSLAATICVNNRTLLVLAAFVASADRLIFEFILDGDMGVL